MTKKAKHDPIHITSLPRVDDLIAELVELLRPLETDAYLRLERRFDENTDADPISRGVQRIVCKQHFRRKPVVPPQGGRWGDIIAGLRDKHPCLPEGLIATALRIAAERRLVSVHEWDGDEYGPAIRPDELGKILTPQQPNPPRELLFRVISAIMADFSNSDDRTTTNNTTEDESTASESDDATEAATAASPAVETAKPKRCRRGAKGPSPEQRKREDFIFDGWPESGYRDKADYARDIGEKPDEVKLIIDRVRKRRKKRPR